MYLLVRKVRLFTSIFMLLACLATGLIAQDNSGNIGGTILDPSGATVANAKVTVTNTDRNQVVRIVTTDPTGSYSIPIIPVGTYAIKVEATGFKAEDRTGDPENWRELVKPLPFGRAAEPKEVADMIVFAASERASFVSGTILTVDGGVAWRGKLF